jgi:hypothetical protein
LLHVYKQPVIYSILPVATVAEQALQRAGKELKKLKICLPAKLWAK